MAAPKRESDASLQQVVGGSCRLQEPTRRQANETEGKGDFELLPSARPAHALVLNRYPSPAWPGERPCGDSEWHESDAPRRPSLALNRRSLCNDCSSKFKGQIATNRIILHRLNRGNRKPSKLMHKSQIVRAVIARMMAVSNAHGTVFVLQAATAPERRRTEVVHMR